MEAFDANYTVQVYRFKRTLLPWGTPELECNAIVPNVINKHIKKTPLYFAICMETDHFPAPLSVS